MARVTVRELIAKLQDLPPETEVIRSGEINGDWAMVGAEADEFEFRWARHLEVFGEFTLHDKRYSTSVPVLVVRER